MLPDSSWEDEFLSPIMDSDTSDVAGLGAGRGALFVVVEAMSVSNGHSRIYLNRTFPRPRRRSRLADECCFLERAPFEVFLVASAGDVSLVTLLTGWFDLVTFQAFGFAGHTSYRNVSEH